MDLELSDDQVALRDGIAALLGGRFDPDRIRAGFDRAAWDELGAAGVFSLGADGFGWADRVVVFEQLGEACVPGPLVAGSLANGCSTASSAESTGRTPARSRSSSISSASIISSCSTPMACGRSTRTAVTGEPSPWPLDPLTPVRRVESLPRVSASAARRSRANGRGVAAHRGVRARARATLHRSRGRVRVDARAVRPAHRLVPGDQASPRRHARARRGGARRRARPARTSTTPTISPGSTARSPAPRCWRARPRSRTARPPPRCSAGWASRGRSTCTST